VIVDQKDFHQAAVPSDTATPKNFGPRNKVPRFFYIRRIYATHLRGQIAAGGLAMTTHLPQTALVLAVLLAAAPDVGRAGGEWPDGPYKEWFQNLQRPDNDRYPERRVDPKSLSCCGAADVVKTRFKVESNGGPYPEDIWFAWLNETWTRIPDEKIVKDYAPNGQPYLFLLAGTIQCFVRPRGGI
jgi:hypothetical protein